MPPSLQTHINFNWNNSTHERERTIPGQQYLDRNRKRLGRKNKMVFNYLMTGAELDADIAESWEPKVKWLNSRCSDLKNVLGFKISRKHNSKKNITTYFCTPEQREFNQQILNTLNLQPQR